MQTAAFPKLNDSAFHRYVYRRKPDTTRFVFCTISEFLASQYSNYFVSVIAATAPITLKVQLSETVTREYHELRFVINSKIVSLESEFNGNLLFEVAETILECIRQPENNIPADARMIKSDSRGNLPHNICIHNAPAGLFFGGHNFGPTDGMISLNQTLYTAFITEPNSDVFCSSNYSAVTDNIKKIYPTRIKTNYTDKPLDLCYPGIRYVSIEIRHFDKIVLSINDHEIIVTPENYEYYKVISNMPLNESDTVIIPICSTAKSPIPTFVTSTSDTVILTIHHSPTGNVKTHPVTIHHTNILCYDLGTLYPAFQY